MSELAKDVVDSTFAQDVIDRSKEIPVVVDLWAPWCGPCRALTPVLERVAADGGFELVKINIDENPVTANELGARSIPLVIAFKDGEQVASFVGAQPEGQVRQFVAGFVPSEVDLMVDDAMRALEEGRTSDAETILNAALTNDTGHTKARLALAELLGNEQRVDEALDLLAKASPAPEVEQMRSALRLKLNDSEGVNPDELAKRAQEGDVDSAVALAQALVAKGDHQGGLDVLLAAVETDAEGSDGAAKQAMLDVFNVLGAADPLVRSYRAKLAAALF